jgi:LAO/AO transport system kinase
LLRPADTEAAVEVVPVSALHHEGIDRLWRMIAARAGALAASGERDRRRAKQAQAALWSEIGEGLTELLKSDAKLAAALPKLEAKVAAGTLTPSAAALQALNRFRGRSRAT